MKNSGIIFILLFSSLFFISCSKDRVESMKDTQISEYESINNYFDNKKQDEQEFIIDTSGSGPVIGNQGTKIWASKEKLMYPNGDSVQWPYTIKLIELYTPKDMLYYQMPNVSSGSLLTTNGEVRIRAFKDGQELVLRPTKTWTVEMPCAAPLNNMMIYYGASTGSYVNWTPNPTGAFNTTAYGYAGEIVTLGWVLCGKTASVSATTTNYTFSSATDNLQNVGTFIYFPDAKSLLQVYNQTSGALPVGENIKIIMIGINSSSEIFHYFSDTQVSSSNQIDVTLTQISDADLTAILDAF